MKRNLESEANAYIAGFFDGDGSVCANVNCLKGRMHSGSHVQMSQNVVRCYMSGLFDTDGTLGVASEWSNNPANKTITFKSRAGWHQRYCKTTYLLLKRIARYLRRHEIECHVLKYPAGKNIHRTVVLNITGLRNVRNFCRLIFPYVQIKRPQVEIFLFEIYPLLKRGNLNWRGSNQHKKIDKKRTIELIMRLLGWIDELNKWKGHKRGRCNVEYFGKILKEG